MKQPQMVYVRQKSQRNKKPLVFLLPFLLVGRDTITVDGTAAERIIPLLTGIARVTLYGVDRTVFAFLHNACVVDCTVIIPIKKDNISCRWLIIPTLPLSVALKPIHTVRTKGILWYDSAFQITALVGYG